MNIESNLLVPNISQAKFQQVITSTRRSIYAFLFLAFAGQAGVAFADQTGVVASPGLNVSQCCIDKTYYDKNTNGCNAIFYNRAADQRCYYSPQVARCPFGPLSAPKYIACPSNTMG